MALRANILQRILLGTASATAMILASAPAMSQDSVIRYNIPPQPVDRALRDFGLQNGMTVMADAAIVRGKRTDGLREAADPDTGLRNLLKGTGLTFQRDGNIFVVRALENALQPVAFAVQPQNDEIVVTAQRREERITDVPIAMTALSGDSMQDLKIEGGSELLRAIPNVSFSKTNFSGYNFQIRGIGTQSISASSDPGVAVSFNSTPLIRNRLFEAEFFDVQRVEVLRGPQGTLYGRNATAGVVNMIPNMPEQDFSGELKGEVGNYKSRRLSGMLNIPITETLGFRIAGAATKRDGFDYNSFTDQRVNGRDLWSARATLAWEPSDRFRASVIWERFQEDDDRARATKTLCTRDPGATTFGSATIASPLVAGKINQGCLPGSLYDDAALAAPFGPSLAYIYFAGTNAQIGQGPNGNTLYTIGVIDPYAGVTQSRNMREVSSNYDPRFQAKNDVVQLNLEFNPTDTLQLISQTAYSRDNYFSTQDYQRMVGAPLFNDSSDPNLTVFGQPLNPILNPGPTPGGIRCDYQLGCSDRMITADMSRSRSRQWSQEVRLQSSFDGPVNFLAGANYIDFKTQDDYYVFNNLFTLIAEWNYNGTVTQDLNLATDPCLMGTPSIWEAGGTAGRECIYVDPNSIDNLNNQGHNYYLSQNGVNIQSWAAFGELYVDLTERLKLTVGGRYTIDKKRSDQIPTQLLLGGGPTTGGNVNSGYPALQDINQKWGRLSGRVVLDWKPDLSFSDDTLIYASVSRGYKGGGTNPPRVDLNPDVVQFQPLSQTFEPEYVNAFEVGMKNSFDGGRFTLNATAFYYDYENYQISQITDRIAFNENFAATSWGLEFEAAWRPTPALRIDGNLGYLRTRLGKGAQSIDVMNRTQGDPALTVLRPNLQVPSNCVAPTTFVEQILLNPVGLEDFAISALCPGSDRLGTFNPNTPGAIPFYAFYGFTYDPSAPYNPDTVGLSMNQGGSGAPNGGRGVYAQLEGNELPNAPRFTGNIGAQYTIPLDSGNWALTLRGDYYRQTKSFGRIYNSEFDRLRDWDFVNMAVTLTKPSSDLTFQLYVKNVFNNSPITGFFVNSDDTGLTTNVFTLDPRIIAFSAGIKF